VARQYPKWYEYQYPEWCGTRLHKEWRRGPMTVYLIFVLCPVWYFFRVPLVVLVALFLVGLFIIFYVHSKLWITLPPDYAYKVPTSGPGSDHPLVRPKKAEVPARITPKDIVLSTKQDLEEITHIEEKTRSAITLQTNAEVQAARKYFETLTDPKTQDLFGKSTKRQGNDNDDTDTASAPHAVF
jgi:hypothetical protein